MGNSTKSGGCHTILRERRSALRDKQQQESTQMESQIKALLLGISVRWKTTHSISGVAVAGAKTVRSKEEKETSIKALENGVFILPEVEIKYGNKTYMSDLIFVEKKEFFLKPHQRTDYFTQKQLVFGNENIPKPNREVNLDVIFNEHIPRLNPINNDDLFF
jgi:hypothetical protein